MSNFTRFSLLVSFPNTDPSKYHVELISKCLRRAVMSFVWSRHVVHQFQSISSLFDLGPFSHYVRIYVLTNNFDDNNNKKIIPGLMCAASISRSSRPTFMLDFRKSRTSFHLYSLSFSFSSKILKCFLKYCSLWLPSLKASLAVYSVSCRAFFSVPVLRYYLLIPM